MSEKMKPCPFCGYAEPTLIEADDAMSFDRICCSICGTDGPYGDEYPDAVTAWNIRQGN